MEHSTSKIKVYHTEDYKVFRNIEGNRVLNKNKIQKIIKEIEAGNDILDLVPILVRENGKWLDVLDGQHRFEVAKKLGRPVHYILQKIDMNLYAVAKVNSNTEKWKASDFVNCYIKAGNDNYKKILKMHKDYGIAIGLCCQMLTYGGSKHDGGSENITQLFEQGLFVVKKWKEAIQIAEVCKNFEKFPHWNSRAFIMAITKIMEGNHCDFALLMKKYQSDPDLLKMQPNFKGYLNNLDLIYNKGSQKRRVLY